LGFGERDIEAIFLAEGVIVGILGGIVGAFVGLGLIEILAQVRFSNAGPVIGGRRGFILARETWPYIAGAFFALVASAVAALIPARRAARLNPVDIVRGAA